MTKIVHLEIMELDKLKSENFSDIDSLIFFMEDISSIRVSLLTVGFYKRYYDEFGPSKLTPTEVDNSYKYKLHIIYQDNDVEIGHTLLSIRDEIDKSIARMQKVKQELTTTENQLRLANKKAEDLTIKKLTYNNPTMKAKFKGEK